MDLFGILSALRRRWAYINSFIALGLLTAAAFAFTATPVYTGTAQVFVSPLTDGATPSDLAQGSTFIQQQVNTYARMVETPLVLQPVIDQLDLTMSLGDLAGKISSAAPVNTSLVSITVSDASGETAAALSNALAASLVNVIPQLEQGADGLPGPVRATLVEPAQTPGSPASPNIPFILVLGLLVGLAVGVSVALLRERTDTTIRDRRAVTRISAAPVLASIPVDSRRSRTADGAQTRLQPTTSEAFRQLRTSLLASVPERTALLVTSSVTGEGKSLVAVHLAMATAGVGSRVLLIDADLRPGRDPGPDDDGPASGLSAVLAGWAELGDVIRPWPCPGTLDFVPAGDPPPNPSELLGGAAMALLLEQARASYDLVLIDAPPLLPVTDAAVLARQVDGVIVVVGRERVSTDELLDACATLDSVHAAPAGFVLNFAARVRAQLPTSRRGPRPDVPGRGDDRGASLDLERASHLSAG